MARVSATQERLEYLHSQIEDESISYSELIELQNLADHIDPTDVVLLEWAGVPEFPDPSPGGNFDLSGKNLGPGDARLEAAMTACRDETGSGPGLRITIGG